MEILGIESVHDRHIVRYRPTGRHHGRAINHRHSILFFYGAIGQIGPCRRRTVRDFRRFINIRKPESTRKDIVGYIFRIDAELVHVRRKRRPQLKSESESALRSLHNFIVFNEQMFIS